MPTPVYGSNSFTNIPDVNGTPVLLNGGGVAQISSGIYSSLPVAGNTGNLYIDTTNNSVWRDNGTAWDPLSRVLNVYSAPGAVTTTTANTLALSNTIPPVTMGIQVASITLTPVSVNSSFLITSTAMVDLQTSNAVATFAAFQGTVCISFSTASTSATGRLQSVAINTFVSPATTSSITFQTRIAATSGAVFVNRSSAQTTLFGSSGAGNELTILEIG